MATPETHRSQSEEQGGIYESELADVITSMLAAQVAPHAVNLRERPEQELMIQLMGCGDRSMEELVALGRVFGRCVVDVFDIDAASINAAKSRYNTLRDMLDESILPTARFRVADAVTAQGFLEQSPADMTVAFNIDPYAKNLQVFVRMMQATRVGGLMVITHALVEEKYSVGGWLGPFIDAADLAPLEAERDDRRWNAFDFWNRLGTAERSRRLQIVESARRHREGSLRLGAESSVWVLRRDRQGNLYKADAEAWEEPGYGGRT